METVRRRVLVLPAGSVIGLEIIRSLAGSPQFEVVGGSSEDDHSRFAVNEVHQTLPYSHPDFLAELDLLAQRQRIDVVFPANDDIGLELARGQRSGQLRTSVVCSALDTHEIARSKRSTYAHLSPAVLVPVEIDRESPVTQFPLFAKPDRGRMSLGAAMVETEEELAVARQRGLLVMENLPGQEYTIDCFTDRFGRLRYARGRVRTRIFNGISARSTWCDDDRLTAMASAINDCLALRGGWFFQAKERADGELVLLEVAPRIAGTMGLSRASGVNLPLLTLLDLFEADIEIPEPGPVTTVDRALDSRFLADVTYSQAFLGLNNLILHDGAVDLTAIAFIFQCRNQGIAVHLITTQQGDLPSILSASGLAGLFDSIRQLPSGELKWPYVQPADSVFVDASPEQRHAVQENLAIPVFDASNLDVLLNPQAHRSHVERSRPIWTSISS